MTGLGVLGFKSSDQLARCRVGPAGRKFLISDLLNWRAKNNPRKGIRGQFQAYDIIMTYNKIRGWQR